MTTSCTLPAETAGVVAARSYVEELLGSWELSETSWTCVQLLSELATNAVIHARAEFTVELSRTGSVLSRRGMG